jgi:hypothetical protein
MFGNDDMELNNRSKADSAVSVRGDELKDKPGSGRSDDRVSKRGLDV